jgi:hypothetical protein
VIIGGLLYFWGQNTTARRRFSVIMLGYVGERGGGAENGGMSVAGQGTLETYAGYTRCARCGIYDRHPAWCNLCGKPKDPGLTVADVPPPPPPPPFKPMRRRRKPLRAAAAPAPRRKPAKPAKRATTPQAKKRVGIAGKKRVAVAGKKRVARRRSRR